MGGGRVSYIHRICRIPEGQELVPSLSFVRNEPASPLLPSTVLSQSSPSVPLRQKNRVQEHELLVRHEYQYLHPHYHYYHVPPTAINANVSVTVSGLDGLTGSNILERRRRRRLK